MKNRRQKREGWFLQRGYSHIDRPLKFEAAQALVINKAKVASLSFFPFLGYIDTKRKFSRDNSIRGIPKKLRPKVIKAKNRELKYAAHRDSYIYSYYAKKIAGPYEELLKTLGSAKAVVGYRSGLGSNVDIAATAFAEIATRQSCRVFCYDIKDFFPSIPHRPLKFALSKVLNQPQLSSDWYRVFRSMTRYSWIDLDQLYFCCLIDPKSGVPNPICADPIVLLNNLRDLNLIRSNRLSHGIPQGSPISATFANISMLEFDIGANEWAKKNGAVYMRYSDDIIFITDNAPVSDMDQLVDELLANLGPSILIGHDKTEISEFGMVNGRLTSNVPITYLGFTFDGTNVRLRARTLSRYYRRMTYATRRTATAARKAFRQGGNSTPHRRALLRDFSHLGQANFYTYSKRAQSTFGGDAIRKQLRNHFKILIRKLNQRGR